MNKKQHIYIVYNIFKRKNAQSIDNIAFTNKDSAVEYCKSKMNIEELEQRTKMLDKNLINWYEFLTKNYIYYIKVVDLI